MSKNVIIIGGGYSVREGIEKNLWHKIQEKEIWSLNSVFKKMPYRPTKQLWVDAGFYKHEADNLQKLFEKGVHLVAENNRVLENRKEILKFNTTRDKTQYRGLESANSNLIFKGRMGLTGIFSISLAISLQYDEIFLLGFDWGSSSIENKNTHWYQDEIEKLNIRSTGAGKPLIYMTRNDKIKDDITDFEVFLNMPSKIWNVSPNSNIPYFDKISYEEFFIKIKNN